MKDGKTLFAEWVAEVGGIAAAAKLLGRSTSGIDHLCHGRRGIRQQLAQAVEHVSEGKYTAASLLFGESFAPSVVVKSEAA